MQGLIDFMNLRWNDIPRIICSRSICREMNIEHELNNVELLKKLFLDIEKESGISPPQTISVDLISYKGGIVIHTYAERGDIDSTKVLSLIKQNGLEKTYEILGYTAISLMEDYGIIRGGPKAP